jgi:hypothetical protein
MTRNQTDRWRRYWDKQANGYDRSMGFLDRVLFADSRSWVCRQAVGEVLEVAIGTGLNLSHYPSELTLTGVEFSPGMLAIARRELSGLVEVVHSDPANFMLEISAPGVTKASALTWLADSLNVSAADVVAFGDMPNDVPMLAWAGSGYAMSGGHPEAIAAAEFQAPPCAEDGVAQILEGLLS